MDVALKKQFYHFLNLFHDDGECQSEYADNVVLYAKSHEYNIVFKYCKTICYHNIVTQIYHNMI